MQVILLERIERLGKMGEVVKVKPGFARNFLLPQKKALRATPENLAYFVTQRARLEAVNQSRREEAEAVAKRLDGQTVILLRQAGEGGQLYGSVTTRDIVTALGEAGFAVERRQINLGAPIKALGIYAIRIALHPEVATTVSVNVAKSGEEADAQAAAAAAAAVEPEPALVEAEAKPKRRKKQAAEPPPGTDTAFEATVATADETKGGSGKAS